MTMHMAQEKQQAGVEDILLAILGVVSGPLLWWMGQSWKSQPAASSLHTLEYWIALICGLVGAALAAVWLIFLVAGMAFVIGVKTRRTAVTYWSELFTPRFLRRILISALGAQLAFSSQAVASPEHEETSRASQSVSKPEAFMPYVEAPTEAHTDNLEDELALDSHSPVPDALSLSPTSHELSPNTATPTLSPQPRATSHVVIAPKVTSTMNDSAKLTPMPRQTSTISEEAEPLRQETSDAHAESHRSQKFLPQPVPVSPHVYSPPVSDETTQNIFVVKAGDCLWDIAHYELGADATLFQIDNRWRQWWEHNYHVLGDDPHTIQPGSLLEIPPFTD
ncbi:hypothetical protein [Enteractinococcus coprophilus]|uniref:LysM domain-containing protein n=1 Tax=Enteractinococcus coprophilus TaxID=1027633 RepID=A0A542ZZY0_9MICC|nr:hypothetical protein [Enteractinococcus coprophilus]TQL65902.1 hypothetical protein FB556_2377 [Enteractinococcus coprophilus]